MVDHAHDARDTLAVVSVMGSDDRRIPNLLAEAQVHATLALVEQQRIANLLMLLKPEDPRQYDTWDEIADALGIGEVRSDG